MPAGIKKYNPAFQSDEDVVASFCVRQAEYQSLLESLRASTSASNTHSLVIGPRGSGKTHLLLRVAAEIRQEPHLSGFYPIVFAEESYEVSTAGEFWLECLEHLAEQAPVEERANLRLTCDDLRSTADDRDLGNRCLAAIRDFADRHGKRLVLLVENLNMLFADMSDSDAGWRLRHTLQNEPQIILFGSATSRFDEIDHPDHALYDLFRVITLRPLNTQDCATMWETISGRSLRTREGREIRPLEILTGGNPRLLAIIARFSAGLSFEELMDNLLDLVDDHTDYFKGHIELLPAQERRVYLALARLWKPATAKEVAEQARADTNSCSALLKRLMDRGAVSIVGGTPRRREYYLTERLYNIYYLLRRGGGTSQVVQELIDFMICMYSPTDLWDVLKRIYFEDAAETGSMPPKVKAFLAKSMLDEASSFEKAGDLDKALTTYDGIVKRLDEDPGPESSVHLAASLMSKIPLLHKASRGDEIVKVCDALVDRFQGSTVPYIVVFLSMAFTTKAAMLTEQRKTSEALDAVEQAAVLGGEAPQEFKLLLEAGAMLTKAVAFTLNRQEADANATLENLVSRVGLPVQGELAKIMAMVLSIKGSISGQPLNDREVLTLLSCISQSDTVPAGSIGALTRFSSVAGPARTLELIKASGTSGLLLPLETALRQELGQDTNVALEVEEVAWDVRQGLAQAKANLQSGTPSVSATAIVISPEE